MRPPNIIGYLEKMIFRGWIVVIGGNKHFKRIEEEMDGKDTQLLTIPVGKKVYSMMLIRKTPGVYTAFGRSKHFKYLIGVHFFDEYTDTILDIELLLLNTLGIKKDSQILSETTYMNY